MSRPMLLVFLLLILIVTSQFEWKQPLMNEMEESPGVSQRQKRALDREEIVKEKIILSQEKNIQRLNKLVQDLREQLLQCRGSNKTINGSGGSLFDSAIELERQHSQED